MAESYMKIEDMVLFFYNIEGGTMEFYVPVKIISLISKWSVQ